MWKITKAAIAVPLLFIIFGTLISGCAAAVSRKSSDPRVNPFTTERIATVRLVMKGTDWNFCLEHAYEEQYVRADFWFDDELVPDVGVRPKGNSSLGQSVLWDIPRMPLAVDFNIFNRARTFHGMKKIFLNNGWSDPTLIREVLAYDIFDKMGLPTPRASLVDLWVNDMRLGVYTMVEMVDQAFLQRHFKDATGNLYKPEISAARLDWTEKNAYRPFHLQGTSEYPHHDPVLYTNIGGAPLLDLLKATGQEETVSVYEHIPPKPGIMSRGLPPVIMPENLLDAMMLKTNENNPNHSALFRFLDVLNNEPDETFPQEIEKVLDVDQTLRFIAVSCLLVHLDNHIGVGHNNYLYEANGRFTFIPWDTNMAFGTFNMGIRKDGVINYYIDEPTGGPVYRYPVVRRLLSYEPYLETYRGYLREALDGPFSLDYILPRIDRIAEMVRPYAESDTQMLYSFEDWGRCFTEDLRPPDIFEGWMAGGPSPELPYFLHREEHRCLLKELNINHPYEIMGSDITPEQYEKLEHCLRKETYEIFLQNIFGPLMSPQPPRQPGFGPNSLGLKTFIKARYESVRQQLNGERPSRASSGSGNNGSMWMIDWMKMIAE